MAIRNIRYGGSSCDKQEEKAIIKSVKESIRSGGWQQGKQGDLMEKEAAKFLNVKHAILTTSGSCAGLLALTALELPKGSEVIISACTFPTIFNIILQCGLVPVVVDAKVGTYTFDVKEVERAITPKTGAIIAIHPVGNPVDMVALMKMVNKVNHQRAVKYKAAYKFKKIYVIEDNCDGWGSTIGGRKVGGFGDVSFTSFHAAHIVSMGVGGGVFSNDKKIAERVRVYRDWGRQANTSKKNIYKSLPKDYNPRFIYEKVGYNFQILDLQAAMGRIQLKKAGKIMKARKKNFDYLYKHLAQFNDLILPIWQNKADVCWFAIPLTTMGDRGELVAHLEKHGIETRSMFAGNIIKHPAYKESDYKVGPDGLEEADYILRHSFWIGVHPRMTQADREYVVDVFKKFYAKTA
jgi:CDP-6-deoxy-D-xylo-4-hexulose-3-dehydrase